MTLSSALQSPRAAIPLTSYFAAFPTELPHLEYVCISLIIVSLILNNQFDAKGEWGLSFF
jgi:hypothetical protein